jgi:transcriptional antiterminator RfaH
LQWKKTTQNAKETRTVTMLLTPSEISRQSPIDWWFCLRTQLKREHIAAACLRQNSEIEVFCPRVRFRKQTNRGPVWFVEAMFPGYLFAQFDYSTFHRRVRQGPGVSGFVHFGDRLGLLPAELIRELKARVGQDELVEFNQGLRPGENAQITQGPFQGSEAVVTRLIAARDRVEILINWMGRSLHAEGSIADLVPLTGPRL